MDREIFRFSLIASIDCRLGEHTERQGIVDADNAGPHVAKCVAESMDHNPGKRAPHPPYSPDLGPSDFYLFRDVKHQLPGHEFTEGAELVLAISEILNQIPTDALVNVFDD
jgi:histone-lysine N-methyltransferase SETMAR